MDDCSRNKIVASALQLKGELILEEHVFYIFNRGMILVLQGLWLWVPSRLHWDKTLF